MLSLRHLRAATISLSIAGVVAALWVAANAPRPCTPPPARAQADLVAFEPVFGGRGFEKPMSALPYPSRDGEWLVATHRGLVFRLGADGESTFLDLTDRVELGKEWGLQDIALAPEFPADPRVFVAYVTEGRVSRVSEFRSSDGGGSVSPDSERILLAERHPIDEHAIASLRFGPDGLLYIAWGEAGLREADSPRTLRGKLLRIDVRGATEDRPYRIPADNPYLGTELAPEAFATGLRMPWRFSFDRETGALWLGDVGSHHFEEVNRVSGGTDYGWPRWEGSLCLLPDECGQRGGEPPLLQQTHSELCAIIGGYVYRGQAIRALRGRYVYADACTGTVWAIDAGGGPAAPERVGRAAPGVASFAEDADGELYVVTLREDAEGDLTLSSGRDVRKMVPSARSAQIDPGQSPASPSLAELGCVAPGGPRSAPPNMIRYEINQQPWEDGAETVRFVTPGEMRTIWGVDVETLVPPPDSLLMKTFLIDGRPIETQLLARGRDGEWAAFDYRWNEDGSDAEAVSRATEVVLGPRRAWQLPGPEGCERCHHLGVGMLRGFAVSQLNRDVDGRNQIERLEALGSLVWPWKGGEIPSLPSLDDASRPPEERARAYLQVNCAHCHQPGGHAGASTMDLRRETPLPLTRICDAEPRGVFPGHEDARLLSPGDPARSLLAVRLRAEGPQAMPPQRRYVDTPGADTVAAWIRSLAGCP